MNILIASDSFKGSLSAKEVVANISKGILKVLPDSNLIKLPLADGGEGTVSSLVDATDGEIISMEVTGPLGNCIDSYFGLLGDGNTAVVEMTAASGLTLIPPDKTNPMETTTYGTGELIKKALNIDIEELIVGIGGSATNDAGVGMAQALGVKFCDKKGKDVGWGGKELNKIEKIDISGLDPRIDGVNIRVACDVNNPFYGPEGAAYVYAPQKGADPEMVEILDNNLRHLAEVIKRELDLDVQNIDGAGAAGGLGGGLVAFLKAELEQGIDIILDASGCNEIIDNIDLVITGEGKLDNQTVKGKAPVGVAKRAKEYDIPVIAIGAVLGHDVEKIIEDGNIDAVFSILQDTVPIEEEPTTEWIQFTTEQILRASQLKF